MLVLENLTYRFLKPNVLDIKLGTQLYDEEATLEKQERMMQASKSTTSWQTGMRLTGFQVCISLYYRTIRQAHKKEQVWDAETSTFIKTDKSYGKSLTPSTLPEGLSRFFCLASDTSTSVPHPSVQSKTADVDENSSSQSTSATPLPPNLLFRVLEELLTRLQDLDHLLHDLEFRMRGGSILIVVEGDAEALEEALYREAAQELRSSQRRERRREIGVMSGEIEESDEEDVEGFNEDDDDASSSASDDSAATSDSAGLALPHTRISLDVRLIDFAHTRAAPGEGPDEGVLKGLGTLQHLIIGLIERLKFEHPSECEE